MEPANMRQKLHQYIDKGDDKLLKLMYVVAKEYNDDDDFEYQFSEDVSLRQSTGPNELKSHLCLQIAK